MNFLVKLHTVWKLGLSNVLKVLFYRFALRTGLHPVQKIKAEINAEEFFSYPDKQVPDLQASARWDGSAFYFGWNKIPLSGKCPEWFSNPFNGNNIKELKNKPWWKIPDFGLEVGDIKIIWEPSRFDWVIALAQRSAKGDVDSLHRLNEWLADWCRENPAYLGPNWKCGQEASIRVMHLTVVAKILGQVDSPCQGLVQLIQAHMQRIYPTLSYAKAQDNNHGISEAAALFIGGGWLQKLGISQGERWHSAGRRLLENRISYLIEPDGSFSQYSVNYHRVLIDTLCLAEIWRGWQQMEAFSETFYDRAKAASLWLFNLVDSESGDAPNFGANDGARLIPLTDTDYRDYRSTVQLSLTLFANKRAYKSEGSYNFPLKWLNIDLPDKVVSPPGSKLFEDGGYALLFQGDFKLLCRYPCYRFRPKHCDALHVDFWHKSNNILRDLGSYSYNTDPKWLSYFTGTAAHNTIEFDDRDQMPSLGRFLRGKWLTSDFIEINNQTGGQSYIKAKYTDWQGASHFREVYLKNEGIKVKDIVDGFSEKAVLRWHLMPGKWDLKDNTLTFKNYSIRIFADVQIERLQLGDGWESRYYSDKTPIPVLEVEIRQTGTITTELTVTSTKE